MPTREVYWNIEGEHWLYAFFIIALAIFGYGVYQRIQLWKLGQPENRWQDIGQGIKDVLAYGFGHKRILKDAYPGIMHFAIFWGFVFLFIATAIITLQADFKLPVFQGGVYLFVKFTSNLFGLLALIGIVVAAFRRYVQRPNRLDNKPDDAIMLLLLFVLLFTGFLIEGARMAAKPDPWSSWGFVGQWLASVLQAMFNESQLLAFHRFLWWFHLILAMGFVAYFPYSKLFHIILGPVNQFMRKRGPIGIPEIIDFEDESIETYGKSQLREFSWKTLFNTDVCLRCGRCQDNCPAYLSGKHLSPKRVIQDMRVLMEETGAALKEAKKKAVAVQGAEEAAAAAESAEEWTGRALIGEVIPEDDLWACTTCRSCEQQCPVFIEHVDKTIDMRRNLVLMESRFPSEAQLAFRNMENNGNPWGIGWSTRADFLTGLGVKTYEENPEAEILYWPGCSGAFDARNQKVSAALVKLLQAANVNFAILGNEEKCCGDSARKLGNEYLFYSLATENIEVMKGYGVKKILTQCPHCFNLLKNEYPQFGGEFEVVHHTEYLKELMNSGKLKLTKGHGKTVTYHDSCYLGRYNEIYEQPRELLKAVGLDIKEMAHTREKSFCCGAGGGRMWLEEHEGERINVMRTDEALALSPDLIGTACPFCLTMINDGIAGKEAGDQVKALDIAEILEQAL
ncbi:heterodisulfide reductase-related iron-sulfur binding cluster [Paradesulfitobacterium ferrireducens]|uniref:heterodisulfide reductase-related iron-sulfur binding cluster n=1 Tax=Paradesulfitobacterium ferrireducens TaxID=2816476 RepID=UPI001A8CE381|nr:heterodisulfide reductase-related iron-sulfur binding cluster [Paradesulfitobacterium ferrireducens]